MAKIVKKAQAGIARSFLAKYMGESAENQLSKNLLNVAREKAAKEAAIIGSTKQIARRTPAVERASILAERNAQRKTAGLETRTGNWDSPKGSYDKKPFSERFSGARDSFKSSTKSKGTPSSSNKSGRIEKDYKGNNLNYKKGGKVVSKSKKIIKSGGKTKAKTKK